MKKTQIAVILTIIGLLMGQWSWSADAAPAGLSLSYSFVGCSGNQATYDLIASHPMGGTFTWSQGATVLSGPHDDPNYATTSYIKISQMIWVNVVNKSSNERVTVHLPNPCIYP